MQPEKSIVLSERVAFGGGDLYVRSSTATPYLVVVDRGRGAILSLAVGPDGYVIHPAADVKIGAPLEPEVDPNEVRR